MTLTDAVKRVRKIFPDKYLSVDVECTNFRDGTFKTEWCIYVEGYSFTKKHATFREAFRDIKLLAGIIKRKNEDVEIEKT